MYSEIVREIKILLNKTNIKLHFWTVSVSTSIFKFKRNNCTLTFLICKWEKRSLWKSWFFFLIFIIILFYKEMTFDLIAVCCLEIAGNVYKFAYSPPLKYWACGDVLLWLYAFSEIANFQSIKNFIRYFLTNKAHTLFIIISNRHNRQIKLIPVRLTEAISSKFIGTHLYKYYNLDKNTAW